METVFETSSSNSTSTDSNSLDAVTLVIIIIPSLAGLGAVIFAIVFCCRRKTSKNNDPSTPENENAPAEIPQMKDPQTDSKKMKQFQKIENNNEEQGGDGKTSTRSLDKGMTNSNLNLVLYQEADGAKKTCDVTECQMRKEELEGMKVNNMLQQIGKAEDKVKNLLKNNQVPCSVIDNKLQEINNESRESKRTLKSLENVNMMINISGKYDSNEDSDNSEPNAKMENEIHKQKGKYVISEQIVPNICIDNVPNIKDIPKSCPMDSDSIKNIAMQQQKHQHQQVDPFADYNRDDEEKTPSKKNIKPPGKRDR